MSLSKAHPLPYNQLITSRFHIQVLVLVKIAYFQEKVACTYLATNIYRNNTIDFDKVSTKL